MVTYERRKRTEQKKKLKMFFTINPLLTRNIKETF